MTTCQWYAMCSNDAVGTVFHPILGDVPICQRCSDKHDLGVASAEHTITVERSSAVGWQARCSCGWLSYSAGRQAEAHSFGEDHVRWSIKS